MKNGKKVVWLVLAMVAAMLTLTLLGCGSESAGGEVASKSLLQILNEKLVPTTWYWWLMAIVSLWPIVFLGNSKEGNDRKGSVWTMAMGCLLLEVVVIYWWILIPLGLLFLFLAKFAGKFFTILAQFFFPIVWLWKKNEEHVKGLKETSAASKGGKEAERPFNSSDVRLHAEAVLGSIFIASILFGGNLPGPWYVWLGYEWSQDPTIGQYLDVLLRNIGVAMAIGGAIAMVWDLTHCGWTCPHCKKWVRDWGQNKEHCTHCKGFNLKVTWVCRAPVPGLKERCGTKNAGTESNCGECGAIRPRSQAARHNRQQAEEEPAETQQPEAEEAEVDKGVECPSCAYPNPQEAQFCANCGAKMQEEQNPPPGDPLW